MESRSPKLEITYDSLLPDSLAGFLFERKICIFHYVTTVTAIETSLTDQDCRFFQPQTRITQLRLGRGKGDLSLDAIKHFSSNKKLEELYLYDLQNNSHINKRTSSEDSMPEFPRLKSISLVKANLTCKTHLRWLSAPNLKKVTLRRCQLEDENLVYELKSLPIEDLSVSLGDEKLLTLIPKFKKLKFLGLGRCDISVENMSGIGKLQYLEILRIYEYRSHRERQDITDKHLFSMYSNQNDNPVLPSLTLFDIHSDQVSTKGISFLAETLPNLETCLISSKKVGIIPSLLLSLKFHPILITSIEEEDMSTLLELTVFAFQIVLQKILLP